MTNIFVTGATGFVGSYLIDNLSQNPENKIYGLARSIKHESTFKALHLDQRVEDRSGIDIVFGNVNVYSDIEDILATYDIDVIYHLSSQPIVKIAAKAPLSTYSTNVMGTINVLEAVRNSHKNINVLVMSSDKAYGNSEILPYVEDMPLNANDIYSSSKACEDIISRTYANNYGLPIVVARPSNIYGIDFHFTRLIPSLAKACIIEKDEKDRCLELNKGSYHYLREYNYAKDAVRALVALTNGISKTAGNAYNISSGNKYTTKQIVEKFIEISGVKKEIRFKEKESTFKEIEDQYLDTTKLKKATDWKSKYNLESGLRETIDGYKKWLMYENEKDKRIGEKEGEGK